MATHKNLKVDEVQYDPKNPRIAHFIEPYCQVDHDLIGGALQPGDAKFIELKQAILSNNGIINPIIVNRENGKLITIEGNTRLAIYKKYHEEDSNDIRWSHIPAIVYDEMSDSQIHAIRLQAHLVGVRNWSPYAKARYLHDLSANKLLPINDLIEFCGGNRHDVLRNIAAFHQMDSQYRTAVPEDQFDERKFSLFLEAQTPKIKHAITSAGFKDQDFISWVVDNKFHPRQELIRQLPQILKSPRARKVFLEEGANEASRYIERPELAKELLEASLVDLSFAIQEKIKDLKLREIKEIKSDIDSSSCVLDASEALRNLYENEISTQ